MAGLLWPIAGDPKTNQQFDGDHPLEPAGFLIRDGTGPRRARSRRFPDAVRFEHLHGGVDIDCEPGTPVRAPEAGRIVVAGTYEKTGEHFMMLQIKPGTVLFFTHLRPLNEFDAQEGQHVERGVQIARSGRSGHVTGPHLHWEVRVTKRRHPRPRRSSRWFKWNPERLRVDGDLAGLPAIQPPPDLAPLVAGAVDLDPVLHPGELEPTVSSVAEPVGAAAMFVDLEPDDEFLDDEADGEDDEFGDAALAAELGVTSAEPIGEPLEF
jgi:murein DD-endopeptidase MepM/ murein hydrolase activator NlpD